VLSHIKGEVPAYPVAPPLWSEQVLIGVARLLRRLHDATVGRTPAAVWRQGAGAPGAARSSATTTSPYNTYCRLYR